MAPGRRTRARNEVLGPRRVRSPGHAFYDCLQDLLREAGFDAFVEGVCRPYYAPRMGAPSLPPGRYFRMHMIGYFEGIDSERGLAWRCADSFSLRDFLPLSNVERVPDHSWLSRTRSRLPHEAVPLCSTRTKSRNARSAQRRQTGCSNRRRRGQVTSTSKSPREGQSPQNSATRLSSSRLISALSSSLRRVSRAAVRTRTAW